MKDAQPAWWRSTQRYWIMTKLKIKAVGAAPGYRAGGVQNLIAKLESTGFDVELASDLQGGGVGPVQELIQIVIENRKELLEDADKLSAIVERIFKGLAVMWAASKVPRRYPTERTISDSMPEGNGSRKTIIIWGPNGEVLRELDVGPDDVR